MSLRPSCLRAFSLWPCCGCCARLGCGGTRWSWLRGLPTCAWAPVVSPQQGGGGGSATSPAPSPRGKGNSSFEPLPSGDGCRLRCASHTGTGLGDRSCSPRLPFLSFCLPEDGACGATQLKQQKRTKKLLPVLAIFTVHFTLPQNPIDFLPEQGKKEQGMRKGRWLFCWHRGFVVA